MNDIAVYPITIRIGDTKEILLDLEDSDGVAIDISGRSYAAQVRSTPESSTVIAAFTCTVLDAAAGEVQLLIPAATTALLSPQVGVWDLQETNGSVVSTLLAGPVEIKRDVTR